MAVGRPFQKGNPGKPKGAKAKKNVLIEDIAMKVIEQGYDKFITELNKLQGKQYCDVYSTFYEYVKPKLAKVDNKIEVDDNTVNVTRTIINGGTP